MIPSEDIQVINSVFMTLFYPKYTTAQTVAEKVEPVNEAIQNLIASQFPAGQFVTEGEQFGGIFAKTPVFGKGGLI